MKGLVVGPLLVGGLGPGPPLKSGPEYPPSISELTTCSYGRMVADLQTLRPIAVIPVLLIKYQI